MENNRATGKDDIVIEGIKMGGLTLKQEIKILFNTNINTLKQEQSIDGTAP